MDKIFVLDLMELKTCVENRFIPAELALRIAPLGITEIGVTDDPRLNEYLGESARRRARKPINPIKTELSTSLSLTGYKFLDTVFGL